MLPMVLSLKNCTSHLNSTPPHAVRWTVFIATTSPEESDMNHHKRTEQSLIVLCLLMASPGTATAQDALQVLSKRASPASGKPTSAGIRALKSSTASLTPVGSIPIKRWLEPAKGYRGVRLFGEPCQDHVLVTESKGTNPEVSAPSRTLVLDLQSGALFEGFEAQAGEIRCEGDNLLQGTAEGIIAFHIPSKTWSYPRFTSSVARDGASVLHPISREGSSATSFLITYSGADRDAAHGVWTIGQDKIELRQDFPWDGIDRARFVGDRIELLGYSLESVTRKEMFSDVVRTSKRRRAMMCQVDDVAITTPYHMNSEYGVVFVPGGYIALERGTEEITVRHPDGQTDTTELSGCRGASPSIHAVGSHTPSVLYGCALSDDKHLFSWWTPEGFSTWTTDSGVSYSRWSGWLPPRHPEHMKLPVVQLGYFEPGESIKRSKWFDTRTGTLWEGAASHSITTSHLTWNDRELPHRFLATSEHHDMYERKNQRIALHMIDADVGVETRLHTYTDCPGELEASFMIGARVEVRCMTHFGSGHKAYKQKWAEVIDVSTRQRWRLPDHHRVERILPDGAVILGTYKKGDLPEHMLPIALEIAKPFVR